MIRKKNCAISYKMIFKLQFCPGIKAGLRYVYEGNIPGEGGENTYCYGCGKLLIGRYGFEIMENNLTDGTCPKCKIKIDGIGL